MIITGVLESVEVVEIVGLSAELHALSAPSELFHQKGVVLLHDLPDELSWYGRHLLFYYFSLTGDATQKCRLRSICHNIYVYGKP